MKIKFYCKKVTRSYDLVTSIYLIFRLFNYVIFLPVIVFCVISTGSKLTPFFSVGLPVIKQSHLSDNFLKIWYNNNVLYRCRYRHFGIYESFKEDIMSEHRKNVLFWCGSVLLGIVYICVGLFVAPSGSEDQMVYIFFGSFLLLFDVWFFFDSVL